MNKNIKNPITEKKKNDETCDECRANINETQDYNHDCKKQFGGIYDDYKGPECKSCLRKGKEKNHCWKKICVKDRKCLRGICFEEREKNHCWKKICVEDRKCLRGICFEEREKFKQYEIELENEIKKQNEFGKDFRKNFFVNGLMIEILFYVLIV